MTLDEHVARLAKHCVDSNDQKLIKQSIIENPYIMDETTLMSYNIYENLTGNSLMILHADGDGKTIWKWMHDIAKQNHCNVIQCLTNRVKALQRKWGFKPIATYMELEVK